MCRNIRPLFNFDPPATDDEIRASALQYVRKVSGFTKPSQANQAEFERAVDEVAAVTRRLVDSLVTNAPAKDREVEAAKARTRAAARYGSAATGLAFALLFGLPAASAAAQQRSASELAELRQGTPNGTWGSTYERPAHPITLIRDATIMTAAGEELEGVDIEFAEGVITRIGTDLSAPGDAVVIDGTGRFVTPGLIDDHSHVGVSPVPEVPTRFNNNEFDFSGFTERVFIEGREVDLDSRQRRLFERYRTVP